jgi:tetratricopeptide (TPR) repeat protein
MVLKMLLATYLFTISFFVISKDNNKESNIHDICQSSPSACLLKIENKLNSVEGKSLIWFQYKLYQLDALFQLVQEDKLREQLALWIDVEDVPLKFKINIYILYAKMLENHSQDEIAVKYLNKAINKLSSVNQVLPDPMLVIQIANALNYLHKNQQGYDMLIALEKKYAKRDHILLKIELYENLGHFAARLNKPQEHINYRKLCIEWAAKHNNKQRMAVAVYNLARAYQMNNDYQLATNYFNQAYILGTNSADFNIANMSIYRNAQLALAQGDKIRAKQYIESIDSAQLTQSLLAKLNKIVKEINKQ